MLEIPGWTFISYILGIEGFFRFYSIAFRKSDIFLIILEFQKNNWILPNRSNFLTSAGENATTFLMFLNTIKRWRCMFDVHCSFNNIPCTQSNFKSVEGKRWIRKLPIFTKWNLPDLKDFSISNLIFRKWSMIKTNRAFSKSVIFFISYIIIINNNSPYFFTCRQFHSNIVSFNAFFAC